MVVQQKLDEEGKLFSAKLLRDLVSAEHIKLLVVFNILIQKMT